MSSVAHPNARPRTWSSSYYALIAEPGAGRFGDRLALCQAHNGQHVWYMEACQDLGKGKQLTRVRGGRASGVSEGFDWNRLENCLRDAVTDGVIEGVRLARKAQRMGATR